MPDSGIDKFDEMEIELLQCVESNFDVSLDTLSQELDLSKSAIHYRLNKLKESGVITGVTADLNPLSFGLNMVAITEISVRHEQGYSEDIGADLAAIDGIEQVYYMVGDVDFIVVSRIQDRAQMRAVIEEIVAIDGVNETSSRFVMDEVTCEPNMIDNLPDEARSRLVDE